MTIPIAKPFLGSEEQAAAAEVIASGWVTQGPKVREFEQAFAANVGSRHACAVSSCTTALHMCLVALGVGSGDEVITVSHSFIATANSILMCGATPVFVDIELESYNMNPDHIAEAISPKTKAIIAVHQLGMPCDMPRINAIALEYGIPVIEDAACAIGSKIMAEDSEWQHIGSPIGVAACFSFHPRKVITTGDGGMITTNSDALDEKFRLLRQHGMSVPDTVRHSANRIIFEEYVIPAYNYRMTDIQAAIGIEQIKKLPLIVEERRKLAEVYRAQFAELECLVLPAEAPMIKSNWQSYCVRYLGHHGQIWFMEKLLTKGISSRRGVMCAHREKAYSTGNWRQSKFGLTKSEQAQDEGIIIPLYAGLNDADLEHIVKSIKTICSC